MNLFDPSVERARECRDAMDEALWLSVHDLLQDIADDSEMGDDVAPVGVAGSTSLLDYAAYFDFALAGSDTIEIPSDAVAAAIRYLRGRIAFTERLTQQVVPARITNFSDAFYSQSQLDQMRRWWDIEPANRMAIMPATGDEFALTSSQIKVATDLLREAAPELHAEVETIVRDIVLTRPDGTNLINYSGASSFALWGAFTINAETQREWPQLYRQIVHEAGHNLLFSIARDQPLVLDDPADRWTSPIRADPRPMDGIFHAAFVSAREAYAFDAILSWHEKSDLLSVQDVTVLEDLLQISVLAFWSAVETLRTKGHISPLGEQVLADCEEYMTRNFAIEPC